MKVKAAAFHEYNQAAVLDKLLTGMPEMVRAIAEPLSKVDKVTIVSTGSGQWSRTWSQPHYRRCHEHGGPGACPL